MLWIKESRGAVRARTLCCTLLALATAVPAQQVTPVKAVEGLRRARMNGLATSNVFVHVNHDDARTAVKVWFDLIAEKRGFSLDSKIDIVDEPSEIRKRLETGSIDILMMGVIDYLRLESSHLVTPVLTDARGPQEAPQYSYVLIAGRSTSATSIAELRGKNVLVASRGEPKTGSVWLDVILHREHLGRADSFFNSVKLIDRPQSCILPVFFGNADACVVDEINLNLVKELNPQLQQLRILARSMPVIESVVATPVKPFPYRQELIDAMLSLHREVRGRQLLMVFKIDRLVPIQSRDLDTVRELYREYDRLPPSPGHHPSAPPSGQDSAKWGH